MTDVRSHDTEARLEAWLAGRAPAAVPAELEERVRSIPRRSTPVDGVVRARTDVRRVRPVLLAAAVVALGAAVLGGAVLLGSPHLAVTVPSVPPVVAPATVAPSAPAVVPEASPAAEPSLSPIAGTGLWPADFRSTGALLPATVPADVAHGVIDTPIGRARWIRLHGVGSSPTGGSAPMDGPGGTVVWFRGVDVAEACLAEPTSTLCAHPPRPSLAISDGLLGPRRDLALPADSRTAKLVHLADRWWFLGSDPAALAWSNDLETWHPVDPGTLTSPGPASLEYRTGIVDLRPVGDRFVATVESDVIDPGRLVGHAGEPMLLEKLEDGYQASVAQGGALRDGGGFAFSGDRVDVRVTGDGLTFLDPGGNVLGVVPGVDASFADAWARDGRIRYRQYLTIGDDGAAPVALPASGPQDDRTFATLGDRLWTFATDTGEHALAWWTKDGVDWTSADPVLPNGGRLMVSPLDGFQPTQDGGLYVRDSNGNDGWLTTDGQTWTRADVHTVWLHGPRVTQGWVRTPLETGEGWRASTDRSTWSPIDALETLAPDMPNLDIDRSEDGAIGNTVVLAVEHGLGDGPWDVWAIEFEAPAGS